MANASQHVNIVFCIVRSHLLRLELDLEERISAFREVLSVIQWSAAVLVGECYYGDSILCYCH